MPVLSRETVFVFGSNRKGIHGGGAALHAARWCGALRGQGEGLMRDANTGLSCYALPTKWAPDRTLELELVAEAVFRFKAFAREHPELSFQVTRVGCGLAGFTDEQIAPLFANAPENCLLPGRWLRMADEGVARVIVAGSRTFNQREEVFAKLAQITSKIHSKSGFEIVSSTAPGADTHAIAWARHAGFAGSVAEIPADWDLYGRQAGTIRNAQLCWYATHLVAFSDGRDPLTQDLIERARREELSVRVLPVRAP